MTERCNRGNRQTSEADRAFGERMRAQRIELGLSQEALGTLLGVSFQQVQKYEKGINRVSTGRLQDLARALQTTPAQLLAEPDLPAPLASVGMAFLATPEGAGIARAFATITNPAMRQAIACFITKMAGTQLEAAE